MSKIIISALFVFALFCVSTTEASIDVHSFIDAQWENNGITGESTDSATELMSSDSSAEPEAQMDSMEDMSMTGEMSESMEVEAAATESFLQFSTKL